MSEDSNRITKTPALNPRKTPEREEKGKGSMAHCGYERLDGRKGDGDDADDYAPMGRKGGLSKPVYPSTRVYDDY